MTAPNAPRRIESPSGLRVEVNANGSIRRMDHGDILLNLFLGNEIEGGPANLYLRRHGGDIESTPLLGPCGPGTVDLDEKGLTVRGEWRSVRFAASLVLAESAPAWFWHVALENAGHAPVTIDLVYAQDVALAHYGLVRMNEYYVSQYVDHTPLTHAERGSLLAVRQNLSMGGRQPWALIGSLGRAVSFATDALQLHGLDTRAGRTPAALGAPALPGRRHQHEHSMAVIQDEPVELAPGTTARRGFFGWFEPDHPAATSPEDLAFADRVLALPEASGDPIAAPGAGRPPAATLFGPVRLLPALDLSDADIAALFGPELREVERENGSLRSFFTGENRHVALKAKELAVLRPHGHMLRTGAGLTPDEASLTSTAWMNGVFHSMVTQGHVSINRLLSTTRSYLGLFRASGVRVFVERGDGYQLLDVPSAFEMDPSGCRWLYKHAGGLIQVQSLASVEAHELRLSVEVLSGPPCRFLVSTHFAINGDDGADAVPVRFERDAGGLTIRPLPDTDVGRRFPEGSFRIGTEPGTVLEQVGDDALLFADGLSRRQPVVVMVTAPTAGFAFRLTGALVSGEGSAPAPRGAGSGPSFWSDMTASLCVRPPEGSPHRGDVERLREILPWLAHNALVHYLSPRGLEQFSGGGWGTRDVCQGPVEMLLALGRWAPVRDLLLRVFKNQNPDGDWPQWFMFFDRERGIRPDDSHGDIVFWPLLALAQYVLASDDASLLDEVVPFFDRRGEDQAERGTVMAHLERALGVIDRRVIAGTRLAAYGHGDWNDALQPADPSMRERLCSAWTVTLHEQTIHALARALRHVGRDDEAARIGVADPSVRDDFRRLLIVDGILTGLAYFHEDGSVDYLLHPRDRTTGIRYSLLPMIHAVINGLLSREEAVAHVECIGRHLMGPDGARLFDRPAPYAGGPQKHFQRAESSTFFGREIGVMYMHAHLRYAEAMHVWGDAEALLLALRQANPIGIRAVVPSARPRQANCYYSSSDALFADRYEAASRYDEVVGGKVPIEGGWRVYSSGAGIWSRLIHQCFFGVRRGKSVLGIDPVIPASLDGLRITVDLAGRPVDVVYRIAGAGCGPTALTLNGRELPWQREANPYRTGGVAVPMAEFDSRLAGGANELVVHLG